MLDLVERLRDYKARDCCSMRREAADEIERLRNIVAYQESRLSVISHLASRNDEGRVARLEAAIELIVQESNAMKQLKMATDALGRAVK